VYDGADQKMIDVIETVYRGASKGRGLVVAPKGKLNRVESAQANDVDYSTRHKY
jgi:DIM1 family U5 snRNP protein